MDTYLYQNRIELNTRYNISDYDTQIDLCLSGMAAAFCPSMILSRVLERNLDFSAGQQPAIFPIQDIHDKWESICSRIPIRFSRHLSAALSVS